ncbi:MAG: glycosyltransferase family 4 protein [Anaerolineales bacterium]|nr:glycosyltransferase family 4 protein [Anaerolineales bacterium]
MSRPPRLGLDLRLTYYTAGGIAKYIRNLAAALPRLAPEWAHLHVYRRNHPVSYAPAARRVDCWTPVHHRLERWALAAELRPYGLDLLHSPDFIPPAAGYRRSVITVHDLTFLRYPEFLTSEARRYYNGQIAWAVRQADAISADSQATRADLEALLGVPTEKITVIPLGLDAEFQPAARPGADEAELARLGLARGYVLFVGTFEPRKNVKGLLRAYARWRSTDAAAPPLVLVGRVGWLFDETLAEIARLRLEPHVRRLEELPAAALPSVYRAADMLVLPSHYEGFGFPVLEAMGCGTPVICSDRASLPEIAGDAALLVNPYDETALVEAMARLHGDPRLRAALAERGLIRARAFSWKHTAEATLSLYRQVLG